ncbi:MAG: GNAT family N-acetyltransferase [Acutalibacter sp.]|nr:GNAT family N-acetyltransferase [Acutalibacter sp.]
MRKLEHDNTAVNLARAYAKGGYSNCDGFLLSLNAGLPDFPVLWEERPGEGLLFLQEHPRFYDFLVVGNFQSPLALPLMDKPVLFTHVRGQMPRLSGFTHFRNACRMELRDCSFRDAIESAAPGDEDEILALLTASLPAADLPDTIDVKNFSCIRRDGKIVACASGEVTGKGCVLAHVAVAESMRRQGLGYTLAQGALAAARKKGAEYFTLWVDEANLAAVRLYERCGFHKTNRTTEQWIKQ